MKGLGYSYFSVPVLALYLNISLEITCDPNEDFSDFHIVI